MEKVYVLGAGFSTAINRNAPLNNNLFPYIYRKQKKFLDLVRDFIHDFYGERQIVNANEIYPPLPLIEDVLSQLDVLIAEERPLSSIYTLDKLRLIRKYLAFGIALALQDALQRGSHMQSAENFVHAIEGSIIISLNYDIIIDNAILNTWHNKDVDYDIRIRKAIPGYIDPYDYISSSPVKLLKLHGSLNWLYCPRCREIDVTPGEKGILGIIEQESYNDERTTCPVCGVVYEPRIITPTFLKRYDYPLLSNLWGNASRYLENAKNLAFIGYSLPDADMLLRCMIKEAIFVNSKRPQISIINYVNQKDEQKKEADLRWNREIRDRYRSLFGDVTYDIGGFQEYVKRGCIAKDDVF